MKEKTTIRKIVMTINRELLTFLIIEKNVYYSDRKFKALIRVLPKPKNLMITIQKSRNRIPMFIATLFNLSKEEMEEYHNAKTTDELADIIIRDGKKNACILVANSDMQADTDLIERIQKSEVVI